MRIGMISIPFTVAFSWIVFKEKLCRKVHLGLLLMTAGTLALAISRG